MSSSLTEAATEVKENQTVATPTVMVVDDDPMIRKVLNRILTKEGYRVRMVEDARSVFLDDSLDEIDVVLLDLILGKDNGLDVLERIRKMSPQIVVVMLTGQGDIQTAVTAMKMGAYDYIEKPCDVESLKRLLQKVTYTADQPEGRGLKKVAISLGSRREYFCFGLELEPTIQLARKAALGGDSTVLVEGASGTGKELLARYIHGLSSRRDKPFVAVNCAALPKDLMESELFGYEDGAFTGARLRGKKGLVQQAENGTLLLDEVGELPINLQTKLLRFLETKEFYQLGSVDLVMADVRVMASTNADLSNYVKEGRFRQDLYYRLNVVYIQLPTLAQRKNDIVPLAEHFLEIFVRKYNKQIRSFREGAKQFLQSLPWEGNVRELRNTIERAVIVSDSNHIRFADLDPITVEEDIERIHFETEINLENSVNPLSEVRRQVILKVLELTNGNKSKAAKLLKVPRSTLRFYLEKDIEAE